MRCILIYKISLIKKIRTNKHTVKTFPITTESICWGFNPAASIADLQAILANCVWLTFL